MWSPLLLAATPPAPTASQNSEAHTALVVAVIGAAALLVSTSLAPFITSWVNARRGRTPRWAQEAQTDSAVSKKLDAAIADGESRREETARWRGSHGAASDEWVGRVNQRLRDLEHRLSGLTEFAHRSHPEVPREEITAPPPEENEP